MAKGTTIKLPFDKEEEAGGGGGGGRFKEGDYKVKIIKVGTGRSKEKDTPFIGLTFKFADGKYKGKKIEDRLYITPKSLGRIRGLLKVVGIKVPKGKKAMKLDYSKLKGKTLAISLEDEARGEGKKKRKFSRVSYDGFMSLEDYESGGVDSSDDSDSDVSEDSESSSASSSESASDSSASSASSDDTDSSDVSIDSSDL